MQSERKIICIVGPTASGKTGWGVEIAKKLSGLPALPSAKLMQAGEIVSADSRQVYRRLNIGTGKDLKEYGKIKYYLIDICEPGEKFTMFDWLTAARKIVEDIFARGKTPIVVGGTGLYIQALAEGFELVKAASYKLQAASFSRKELETKSLKELQKISLQLKANSSKLDMQNPYRLIRAIERAQAGEVVTKKKPDFEVLQIAIDLPRDVLYQRIDQRVEEWFEQGFIEEVQGLLNAGVDSKWLEKIGLEYKILTQYLTQSAKCKNQNDNSKCKNVIASEAKQSNNGTIQQYNNESFDEMRQKMKYAIHAYARRQLTWFRHFPEIVWCKDLKSAEKTIKKFLL